MIEMKEIPDHPALLLTACTPASADESPPKYYANCEYYAPTSTTGVNGRRDRVRDGEWGCLLFAGGWNELFGEGEEK